jgi:hypothetical protein
MPWSLRAETVRAEQIEPEPTEAAPIEAESIEAEPIEAESVEPEPIEPVTESIGSFPTPPEAPEETGLDSQFLLYLLLKAIYVFGIETAVQASNQLKLPLLVTDPIFETARVKRLVEVLGLTDCPRQGYRHVLTPEGREWAMEALQQCKYVGPAPVPLSAYQAQVRRQSLTHESVNAARLSEALSHLVLPADTISKIGPALNSGKAILLYGAPGNGKTSIAEALGQAYEQTIFIPYCIEADGQIIKIFDPAVHEECEDAADGAAWDARWVRCRRPMVLTGGELTMEMLDLSFDAVSKYYEAPAHIKATGGMFIIDDFGRQRVRPVDLLNRWILPLERSIDYLTLHTGRKLRVPFDQCVVFSTNFPPQEIMDDAALRRIHYKLPVASPTPEDYEMIFRRVCDDHGFELPQDVLAYVLENFYPQTDTARSGAHPRFIAEHVVARCDFDQVEAHLTVPLVRDAVQNLVLTDGTPLPSETRSLH